MTYPSRIRSGRKLTLAERAMAAVTVWLAMASVIVAVSHEARASETVGTLPAETAATFAPPTAISHIEFVPGE